MMCTYDVSRAALPPAVVHVAAPGQAHGRVREQLPAPEQRRHGRVRRAAQHRPDAHLVTIATYIAEIRF